METIRVTESDLHGELWTKRAETYEKIAELEIEDKLKVVYRGIATTYRICARELMPPQSYSQWTPVLLSELLQDDGTLDFGLIKR